MIWECHSFSNYEYPGVVDLGKILKLELAWQSIYASCYIYVPEDMDDLKLKLGSNCLLKLWLNGKEMVNYSVFPDSIAWDSCSVKNINLKKGYNHVVVKTVFPSPEISSFCIRFTDRNGLPLLLKGE